MAQREKPQPEYMNRKRKFLLASVLALQNSSFIYPSCQKCFSRIILVSKRFNCPKCGSTGEAENASYRYRLSIKVAESNKLFGITVFGSCLDAFFGLTATDLHRYIQDSREIPGALDRDATQNLLTKAVETCFVGQNFIFGVTNFENQHGQGSDSNNFLEQCRRREIKELLACQIVLPDPGVAGFTVIDYFRQLLQLSNFRNLHGGSQAPNSHLLALEHSSSSDLSSICGLDSSSCFVESHGRDNFSMSWQPSLQLTSIVSELTDEDNFSASEQSKVFDTLHQNRKCISLAEATGSGGCHDAIQCSWSLVSYMDKKSTAQKLGDERGLQANQPGAVHSSHHEIGVTGSNLFSLKMQESHEPSNTKSFHSAVEIKKRNSQHDLTCHDINTPSSLQERSACCPPISLRLEEIADGSQDNDPKIWDDLPLSESLNKFLAVIESEIAITPTDASSRQHHLDNGIDELQADHSSLSVTPQGTAGALHTPPIALRSSQAAVKANSGKGNFLSNCEANPAASVQESQPGNTAEAVSIGRNGRDISECFLSNASLSALFPASKGLGTASTLRKSTRIPPRRATISHTHSTSESDHSCLNIRCFNGSGEKSPLEMSEKLVTLCSRRYNDVSDLCNLENKQCRRWPKNQGDSLTICRKLTYSLEALCSSPCRSTNALKEMPYGHSRNNLTQTYVPGHESSYNASADLFDDSAKEMDMATETTKVSQDILLQWGKSLAESHHIESDFSLRSLSGNFSQSSQKLPLPKMPASMNPKTCSSPHFPSDSESDVESSQDFVPCSQSTPVAGFHQTRIHGVKGAFKKLPTFYVDLDTNYKKTRISSENEAQQATPRSQKNIKTPSPVIPGVTQPEVVNNCSIAECLASDIDEWVPPTTKKAFLPDMLGFQALGIRKRLAACNSPDENTLPRKKLKHVKQRTNKRFIKKELNLKNTLKAVVANQKTNYSSTHSGWISKESVLELGCGSEVSCCLSFSENWPPSVLETKNAWSPELFSQKVTSTQWLNL
ncbi:DNA damage-induced apoptosis suppressor protein [Eptesicus fuscus]|uniref:DNA damage-induced apoptosis suppressor protein n=1 Tax=Eptesicus fuscus TaxID=29078 RepID=UPI002403AA6B|nr:DNA damage-induced apoptosis suppressor protein [Eptesicus fuscus]XP_054580660.1 DNA damage-induced apoptosis suppressor protein [Eptesicus fuscus]